MSSIVDALYQIQYNPFKYGEHIASFYSSISDVEHNLLLSPLIIPICSHPVFEEKLLGAVFGNKKKSSIWTIFGDRSSLYDLQERIDEFQILTEQSIQYCLIKNWLVVKHEKLSLHVTSDSQSSFALQKSAVNFAKLVSNYSVVELYEFFGAKPK